MSNGNNDVIVAGSCAVMCNLQNILPLYINHIIRFGDAVRDISNDFLFVGFVYMFQLFYSKRVPYINKKSVFDYHFHSRECMYVPPCLVDVRSYI